MTSLALGAVSYNVAGAVAATGVSARSITNAIQVGDLITHYIGSKRVIRAADLDEWIQALPTERAGS